MQNNVTKFFFIFCCFHFFYKEVDSSKYVILQASRSYILTIYSLAHLICWDWYMEINNTYILIKKNHNNSVYLLEQYMYIKTRLLQSPKFDYFSIKLDTHDYKFHWAQESSPACICQQNTRHCNSQNFSASRELRMLDPTSGDQ